MHEVSLARRLLALAEDAARARGAHAIHTVGVRVGAFQSVVPDALRFAFDALKPGTLAADATLALAEIPLRLRCPACGERETSPADFDTRCPVCDAPVEIVSGRELEIEYIEVR